MNPKPCVICGQPEQRVRMCPRHLEQFTASPEWARIETIGHEVAPGKAVRRCAAAMDFINRTMAEERNVGGAQK